MSSPDHSAASPNDPRDKPEPNSSPGPEVSPQATISHAFPTGFSPPGPIPPVGPDDVPPGHEIEGVLGHPGTGPSTVDAPSRAAAPPSPAASGPRTVRLAGYEVLEELGRGGMGVVYKARHLKLGHEVALKVILAGGHADEQELARFHLEAAAVARLKHPGIVHLHEFGEYDGKPFFSLEFVEGGSLAVRLNQGPLPAREAAVLVEKLARAVQHAHEAGILHRDLKPGNVLLTKAGEPKVADFGLAKQLGAEEGLSQTGAVMGTPSYMAPEQAAGRVRELGPPTDVYGLGAILYKCLTGRPPFQGTTKHETLQQVLRQEPVAPRRLVPTVPRDLETVCLRCLEKDATKRYATAADLADDLGRFVRGEPVVARPVGRLGRGWRWCRRNPALAAALTLAATLLLAGTGVSSYFAVAEAEQAETARKNERAAVTARDELKKSNADLRWKEAELEAALGRSLLRSLGVANPNT